MILFQSWSVGWEGTRKPLLPGGWPPPWLCLSKATVLQSPRCKLCSQSLLLLLAHRANSASTSLRPGQPGSHGHSRETLHRESSLAPGADGDIKCSSEAWGHFTGWLSLYFACCWELRNFFIPVLLSPEGSSALLCLRSSTQRMKRVDETWGLVTSVPGDMRCRPYVCSFSTCTLPKHTHTILSTASDFNCFSFREWQ
jgi:hypothetical protein